MALFPKLEKFDPSRTFIARKELKCGGWVFGPGDVFDKALVSDRRLRLMYEQRSVAYPPDGQTAPPLGTAPGSGINSARGVPIPAGYDRLPWIARKGQLSLRALAARIAGDAASITNKKVALETIATEVARREAGA